MLLFQTHKNDHTNNSIAMKLVIGGTTGFLGAEVLSQALRHPAITSVVALARRETPAPAEAEGQHPSLSEAERAKFKPVACEDFGEYPDHVKSAISDADACIWSVKLEYYTSWS